MPINNQVKQLVEERGNALGLKNINDTVRFLLTNFAQDRLKFSFDPNIDFSKVEHEDIGKANPIASKTIEKMGADDERIAILSK